MCALMHTNLQKKVKGCQQHTSVLQLIKEDEKSLERIKRKEFRKHHKIYSKEVTVSTGKINAGVKQYSSERM